MVIHYEEALYQVYAPLPLPLPLAIIKLITLSPLHLRFHSFDNLMAYNFVEILSIAGYVRLLRVRYVANR